MFEFTNHPAELTCYPAIQQARYDRLPKDDPLYLIHVARRAADAGEAGEHLQDVLEDLETRLDTFGSNPQGEELISLTLAEEDVVAGWEAINE